MSDAGMGTNRPRVGRDWEGYLEGQLLPRASRALIGRGGAGGDPRPMRLGLGKRRDESHMPIGNGSPRGGVRQACSRWKR